MLSHRHIQYNETPYAILSESRNLNHSSIINSDNNIKNIKFNISWNHNNNNKIILENLLSRKLLRLHVDLGCMTYLSHFVVTLREVCDCMNTTPNNHKSKGKSSLSHSSINSIDEREREDPNLRETIKWAPPWLSSTRSFVR